MEHITPGYEQEDVYTIAQRKAKYGRHDWIVWQDRNGVLQKSQLTVISLKKAMIATGTQGRFVRYLHGHRGLGHWMHWWESVILLRHLQRGTYDA